MTNVHAVSFKSQPPDIQTVITGQRLQNIISLNSIIACVLAQGLRDNARKADITIWPKYDKGNYIIRLI